ncbi:MAG: SufE family protein [Acidimicrobiia bacterium]|nr:SufE family protein [Acidimicrobiia bacterium]
MTSLPPKLEQLVGLFGSSPKQIKLQALLDYSNRLPDLPDHIDPGEMEEVHECQTPFFVATELADDGTVRMYFHAPPEAPTTRGYAGIISEGLNGLPPEDILSVPDDFYTTMGLEEIVTPRRLRGMYAILARVKRQVSELADAT